MSSKAVHTPKPVLDQALQKEVKSSLVLKPLEEIPNRRVEAFKLATDVQAQRRNLTNNVIIRNPTFVGTVCLLAGFIIFNIRKRSEPGHLDWGTLILSLAGLCMAMISLVGRYTEEIIAKAERMDIQEVFGADKDVFAFIFNDILVGEVAVRRTPADEEGKKLLKEAAKRREAEIKKMSEDELEQYEETQKEKINTLHSVPDDTALVASWAVLRRYRSIGLGQDLLKKAEEVALNKFGAKKIVAVCESTELPAIAILKKRGFKKTQSAKCKGYRGSWFNVRELVWTKELVPAPSAAAEKI